MPDLPKTPDSQNDKTVINRSPNSIYEWRDVEGNLQFSNTPPTEGIEYTVREYDPNTNVIQSIKLPAEETEASATEPQTNKKIISSEDPGNVYSPDRVKKLIGDAKNIENILNDRLKKQQATIGQ